MEYYTKHMGKGRAATVAGACEKGDASALTRVLDLARPEICALGPLMTHLQVIPSWAVGRPLSNVVQSRTYVKRELSLWR